MIGRNRCRPTNHRAPRPKAQSPSIRDPWSLRRPPASLRRQPNNQATDSGFQTYNQAELDETFSLSCPPAVPDEGQGSAECVLLAGRCRQPHTLPPHTLTPHTLPPHTRHPSTTHPTPYHHTPDTRHPTRHTSDRTYSTHPPHTHNQNIHVEQIISGASRATPPLPISPSLPPPLCRTFEETVIDPHRRSQFSFEGGRSACTFLAVEAALRLQRFLDPACPASQRRVEPADVEAVLDLGMRRYLDDGGKDSLEAMGLEHANVAEVRLPANAAITITITAAIVANSTTNTTRPYRDAAPCNRKSHLVQEPPSANGRCTLPPQSHLVP